MKVIYKQTLTPLYPFEDDYNVWDIRYPAKMVIKDNKVYEIDEVHYYNRLICDIRLLVEVIPDKR